MSSKVTESRIPCSRETRKLVAAQKRGGEPYDSVLRKMAAQYNPEEATEESLAVREATQDG